MITKEWLLDRGFVFYDKDIPHTFSGIVMDKYYALSLQDDNHVVLYYKFPDIATYTFDKPEFGIGCFWDFKRRVLHIIPVSGFLDDTEDFSEERIEAVYFGLTGKKLEPCLSATPA